MQFILSLPGHCVNTVSIRLLVLSKRKTNFITGNKFVPQSRYPRKLGPALPQNWRGDTRCLHSKQFSGPRERHSCPKAEFSKQFIYISKTGESADFLFSPKFLKQSKEKERGKSLLPWTVICWEKCLFLICVLSQPSHLYRPSSELDVMIRGVQRSDGHKLIFTPLLHLSASQDLMTRSGPLPARKALHPSASSSDSPRPIHLPLIETSLLPGTHTSAHCSLYFGECTLCAPPRTHT